MFRPLARRLAALCSLAALLAPAVASGGDAASGKGPVPYATPEEAAQALLSALTKNDDAALVEALGPGSEAVVEKGADPYVAKGRRELVDLAKTKLSYDRTPERVTLQFGDDDWPFPMPLVAKGGTWTFDVPAGLEEVLARQIGRHELEAIAICRAYPEMQVAYAAKDRDGDEVREYAQRLLSREGTHDGLYWADETEDDPAPLGVPLAPLRAALKAGTQGKAPHAGYYWRVLHGQGAEAPGGAHSYVINGNMIAGFALLAVPAEYRKTGVTSFLVSHQGKVFQKDLGPDSLRVADAITVYDPDETWSEVSDPGE